jgi:hypothetical protein
MKPLGFPVEAILRGWLAPASAQSAGRWNVEQQREMRHQPIRRPSVHRPQKGEVEAAAVPLIGQCGVGKAIAHHDHSSIKGRSNDLRDMLAACRENKQGFRLRGDGFRRRLEQEAAKLFGERRPSWFSRAQDVMAPCGQQPAETKRLSGFSASFPALQRNEEA